VKRSFSKFVARLDAIGLHKKVEKHSLALHVSLRDLYEGQGRVPPSIANARRFVYLWLVKEGRGYNEIARLFDRAPSGVLKLTLGGRR
jgi:hypothetical protein